MLYCTGAICASLRRFMRLFFKHFYKMEFCMKALNKLLSVAFASALVVSLAGCGDKEETKTFNANINGADIKITYTYEGDKVLKQTSENKINYSTIGAKNKEEAAR